MQNLIETYDMQDTKDKLGWLVRQHSMCSDEEERGRLAKHIKEVVAVLRLVGVLTIDTKKV